MKLSKKMIIISISVLALSSAVMVSASTVSSEKYESAYGTFNSENNLTLEKAKEIANQNVPTNSVCLHTEEDAYNYEFEFYNDEKKEEYKIEIGKDSGDIIYYKINLYDDIGSSKVKISDSDIKEIVLKEIPAAEIFSIKLDDDVLKKYKVKFQVESYYGKFEINPETGIILERKFELKNKYNDIYKNNYNIESYISIDKIKEIVLKEIPNGTIIDIDNENYDSIPSYEIEVNKDGNKYRLVLNALTGEKIYLKSVNDKKHNDLNKNKHHTDNMNVISIEDAKQIALKRAPNATIKEIELDYDDGMAIYEGEMYERNYEYEFEIDAYTGNIINWEEEFDD